MKIVHGNKYFAVEALDEVDLEFQKLYKQAISIANGFKHNLVKITPDNEITLSYYPHLNTHAHPYLEKSLKIGLRDNEWIKDNVRFASQTNPVILHRLETMLSDKNPRIKSLKVLTQEEEESGMYEKDILSKIGRLRFWNQLCQEKEMLSSMAPIPSLNTSQKNLFENQVFNKADIPRHKTAMYLTGKPSSPTKKLFKRDLISSIIYDFGCGKGRDSIWLRRKGFKVISYDPFYRPEKSPDKVDFTKINTVLVNYVLNVIEDPDERIKILKDLSERATGDTIFLISARSNREIDRISKKSKWHRFQDGFVTKRGTFQKGFVQSELEELCNEFFKQMDCDLSSANSVVYVGQRLKV
jgi:hypothetical protein